MSEQPILKRGGYYIMQGISVLLHPLAIATIALILLLSIDPYLFKMSSIREADYLIIIVFATTYFIPLLAIFLMWRLELIPSLSLRNRMDRVGPLIAAIIFYSWMARNLYSNPDIPSVYRIFLVGAAISLAIAFLINVTVSKISLHLVGLGGLLGMFLAYYAESTVDYAAWSWHFGNIYIGLDYFLMAIIIAIGVVMTARLYIRAHRMDELIGGLIVGLFSQLLAQVIFG